MTPEEAAAATAPTVGGLPSGFMLDGATYVKAAELGFNGIDFYAAGRGGVLGEVDSDVVAAGFVFFNRATVKSAWEGSAGVLPRDRSAAEFAGCAAAWADAHLGDDVDWARLADLVGRIIASASPALAPVFAGWRAMPVPSEPKQAALHQLNALRELRMARHGVAVVSCGVHVGDAVRHKSPHMVALFGWDDTMVDGEGVETRWNDAEALTNHLLATDYAVLDAGELDELVALCTAASASVT